ncbi:ABC transporter substrate-binding protein [Brevibacillus borstelensis]|uniref:ABC transporter substrate-binding protein n=1 Tax=Brevibacillus borstelensis TaxID=45462 RepID=UPI0030BB9276
MKKWVSAAMAALMVAVAGCSGGGSDTAPNGGSTANQSGSATSGEKVTLTYGVWDKNQMPAMEEIAKTFTQAYPNIEVKIELTPHKQYFTKMDAAATGDSLPDVFWMNGPNIVKYASNGMLLPLDDKITADGVDMNNYPKALVDLYTVDGVRYGFPKDYDTIGLWYNKKLFDEAKVAYPDETWDWTKLREAAKKLTDPQKGVYGIAARPWGQENFYNTIVQSGGYVISEDKKTAGFDKPETIEGIKFWVDLINEKVSPTVAQMEETDASQLFESGKLAMLYDGAWMASQFAQNEYTKDKVDVAVLPKGKEATSVIHGLANVIAANTKHPNEAWTFVKYLGSKEAAEIQAKAGAAIPAFNGTQELWVKSIPQFNLKVYIDQAAAAKPYPVSKETSKWVQLEKEYMTKAFTGEMNVEEAAKALAAKMNELLAQE